jgi:hypothetical protein
MMTLDEVRRIVSADSGGTECIKECRRALASNELFEVEGSHGRIGARHIMRTLRIRLKSTEAAGIGTCGFQETLNGLAAVPPDQPVEMFHFSSLRRKFSLFVHEPTRTVIGCIYVNRRDVRPGS